MKIVAHRGACRAAPENTMTAFQLAVDLKADMIELDVQESADAEIMVFHDDQLDRLTNIRTVFPHRALDPIQSFSAQELRQLHIFDPQQKQSAESIPTLDLVFDWLEAQKTIQINIELKMLPRNSRNLAQLTVRKIVDRGLEHRIQISSFDHMALRHIKRRYPNIYTAALVAHRLVDLPDYVRRQIGSNAINPAFFLFQSSHFETEKPWWERAAELGFELFPWIVNEIDHWRFLADFPIAGIITDIPGQCRDFIELSKQGELLTHNKFNDEAFANSLSGLALLEH